MRIFSMKSDYGRRTHLAVRDGSHVRVAILNGKRFSFAGRLKAVTALKAWARTRLDKFGCKAKAGINPR